MIPESRCRKVEQKEAKGSEIERERERGWIGVEWNRMEWENGMEIM